MLLEESVSSISHKEQPQPAFRSIGTIWNILPFTFFNMQGETKEIKLNSEDIQKIPTSINILFKPRKKKENSQDSFNLEVVQKI